MIDPQGERSGPLAADPAAAGGQELFSVPLDWSRWWTIIPEIVGLACTGVLPLLVAANVVSRYTNLYRILWAEDVVKVLFLWVVFLGGALAVKYDAHVRLSMLSDRLLGTGRPAAVWSHVVRLSPLAVGVILLVLGAQVVEISMRRELPSLQIPAGYFTTIIPASGALMIFYALRNPRARSTRAPRA
jgi:TRAP-type C4-dicarboxylate transport system permease small subunit